MKTKTLSPEALKNLKVSLSKVDDEPDVIEKPEENLSDSPDTPEIPVEIPGDNEALLAEVSELKESLSTLESDKVKLSEEVETLKSGIEASEKSLSASEKLVTNLSDNLRMVVNSMKVAMGHVELSDSVDGEALLKEYEFTSTKYVETLPTGAVTDEPVAPKENLSAIDSQAIEADYESMPWR